MKTKSNSSLSFAAQNAQQGLINVFDLSMLTGVDAALLNKYSKLGFMNHYGEYHGKRFFDFQEVVNWAITPGDESEAKPVVRNTLEARLKKKNCPYTLEKISDATEGSNRVRVVWKKPQAALDMAGSSLAAK